MVRMPHDMVSPPRVFTVIWSDIHVTVSIFDGTYIPMTSTDPCTNVEVSFNMSFAIYWWVDLISLW